MDDTELQRAYLHNRLEAQARHDFEARLSAEPDLRAETAMLQATIDVMTQEQSSTQDTSDGWARLSGAIQAEQSPEPANSNRMPVFAQMAAVAVASIALWQFVAVPNLPGRAGPGYAPASVELASPALQIVFADAASIADITQLLIDADAVVADGPGSAGLFTLEFTDEAALSAAETAFAARPDLIVLITRP